MKYAAISSVGHSVKGCNVSSEAIDNKIGVSPGWIEKRTGIKSRYLLSKGIGVSEIAIEAAKHCMSGVSDNALANIGLVILATSTPDYLLPPTSPYLCEKLGLRHCGAFDLTGACSGFLYALTIADAYARANNLSVLIIGANVLSTRTDPNDPVTVGIFSDAAGAALIEPTNNSKKRGRILANVIGHKGHLYKDIIIPAGGSVEPFSENNIDRRFITMTNGKKVFQEAVASLVDTTQAVLSKIERPVSDIKYWIPHQANLRLINNAANKLGLNSEQCIFTISQYGNSSAATIPLSISIHQQKIFNAGLTVCASAGAGMLDAAVAIDF